MKKHAPATLRNREAILAVLREELPGSGTVLEIASGSGEHAVFFADHLPGHDWLPSDLDAGALESIRAYREEYSRGNLLEPAPINALTPQTWALPGPIAAIVCINMVHISPWAATEGVFAGAAQRLSETDMPLLFYGPYFEQCTDASPSNLAFDEGLRARNPQWGIRHVEDMDSSAAKIGLFRSARHAMPANNLMLVYRRAAE